MNSDPKTIAILSGILALSACSGASALPGSSTADGSPTSSAQPETVGSQGVILAPAAKITPQGAYPAASTLATPGGGAPQSSKVPIPYPFTQGDALEYAYTGTDSVQETGKPLDRVTTTGTLATTVGVGAKFDRRQTTGVSGVLTYQTTDPLRGLNNSGTTTTDQYDAFVSIGDGLSFETYGRTIVGSSSTSDDGSTVTKATTIYGTPYVIDQLPEVKGANWNEALAYTLSAEAQTTKGAVLENERSTYARDADGSYTRLIARTTSGKRAFSGSQTQLADGSGVDRNDGTGSAGGTTTFSAPMQRRGSFVIAVVFTPASGSASTTYVPDWFPGNGGVPALATDQRQDLGLTNVPAKCGATAGQKAERLRETQSDLDVVRGTSSSETADSYVVMGEGLVCLDRERVADTYDNRLSGALLARHTFANTTGLSVESLRSVR